jgi:hypothetical protein
MVFQGQVHITQRKFINHLVSELFKIPKRKEVIAQLKEIKERMIQ